MKSDDFFLPAAVVAVLAGAYLLSKRSVGDAVNSAAGAVGSVGGLVQNVSEKASSGIDALFDVGKGIGSKAADVVSAVSSRITGGSSSSGTGKAKIIDIKTAEPIKTSSDAVNKLIQNAHDRIIKNLPK